MMRGENVRIAVAYYLKHLMDEERVTISEAARRMKTARANIYMTMRAESSPRMETVLDMLDAFGKTYSDLEYFYNNSYQCAGMRNNFPTKPMTAFFAAEQQRDMFYDN
jgi:hypothetical protein